MDVTQVLSNMILVDIIIGGSTGERTLEADDFIREVGKMLPPGTFSWVSKARTDVKRIILRVGAARQQSSARLLSSSGPRTSGVG